MRETAVRSSERAVLTATRLEVVSSSPAGEAALVIDGTQTSIDDSTIDCGTSPSRAIVFGPASGRAKLTNVRIRHCSDGIVIRGASSANRLQRISFEDISGTAIRLEATAAGNPIRNRVTQCDFTAVATLIGASGGAAPGAPGDCTAVDTAPNRGIAPPRITSFEGVPRTLLALYGRACTGTAIEIYEGHAGDRNEAHYVQTSTPAYDGTFTLLVGKYDATTRMFVTSTDGDGNTSQFAISPPPKLEKK
jgi:hypothetical protein